MTLVQQGSSAEFHANLFLEPHRTTPPRKTTAMLRRTASAASMTTVTTPSMALLRLFSPTIRSETLPWTARGCLAQTQQQIAHFSSTEQRQKRNKGGVKKDPRIVQIRYHLQHPLTPRPLRFSRTRALRHWTIHRAWQRYQTALRENRQLELERQYNSMNAACEALRLIDNHGLTADERSTLGVGGESKEMGRLYRIAMMKNKVWDGVPIEYARIQTETPPRDGWNHGWTR
ncbi:hypothetical protein DOTSEDRAFT_73549 [Dothistroma septosporum NZE10]|uniref:Large ribosomal subunit protein mL40 n=1 Tax=Dothistroma septosporum (strain NZE10 / CBS 128990) TaxID=675120 RepID=N1PHX7_DOTSN|nr:hypothetical protein DOTSEDRAFT_73549 [Dothistroma septosporum NZE10]